MIARRASLELFPGAVVNLGFGIATGIADLAAREGIADDLTLTVEQGIIGGTPVTGIDFGAAVELRRPGRAIGSVRLLRWRWARSRLLVLRWRSTWGNVNVSRFAGRPNGSGGFIHIAQNARAVCFLGTLTAGGLVVEIEDGQVRILSEGAHRRFVSALEQVTYDSARGRAGGQRAL